MTFTYRLERADGTPAEPGSVTLAVSNMRPGDTIPLERGRTLRVVGTVAGAAPDEDGVLIVEDTSEGRGLNSV